MSSPQVFQIIEFDDGNQRFKNFDNKWIVIGSRFNGQKVALKNISNKSITIPSISSWKIRPIMDEPS